VGINRAVGFPSTATKDTPAGKIVIGDGDLYVLLLTWFRSHIGEALVYLWKLSGRGRELQASLAPGTKRSGDLFNEITSVGHT